MSDDAEAFLPLTDLERRFEELRAKAGLFLAPLAFAGIWMMRFETLSEPAHRLAAVVSAVMVLWLTEAIPMPATALLGAAACVVLNVADAKTVLAPFANPLIFLILGSFMLAQAIFLHRLDRRVAYAVMSLGVVGARPERILFAFGATTACLSGWMSNTATTAMMMATGLSIINFLFDRDSPIGPIDRRYATGMMLMTSFAASVGGLMTPIGTPPNLVGLQRIQADLKIEITFFEWMLIGVPVVIVLYLFLFGYLNFFCPSGVRELVGSRELLAEKKRELGPWTRGQISTLVAFLTTVVLWIVPGVVAMHSGDKSAAYKAVEASIPEGVVALLGASLLFLLPGAPGEKAITWRQAAGIDWGVILLYGGGFALGELAQKTGLATAVGTGLTAWLPVSGGLGLLIAATVIAVLVSETTSNTAAANIVVPVVIPLAQAANVDPLEPALAATMAASMGFMLPVSTPCNAIVYGSGYIPLTRMIRYGLLLDVVGIVVIVTLVRVLTPLIR